MFMWVLGEVGVRGGGDEWECVWVGMGGEWVGQQVLDNVVE